MRKGTDLQTLLEEAAEKEAEIKELRRSLQQVQKQNERLNYENIQLKLKRSSEVKNSSILQEAKPQLKQMGAISQQQYEARLADHKQQWQLERRREMQSYELRISELVSSVIRFKNLATMWEHRCQEYAGCMEQSRRRQHDMNIILGNKKAILAKISRALQQHFNEKISESSILSKINELIQNRRQPQSEGDIYGDVLSSIRESKISGA